MFRVALVNMPFGSANLPSIALTQLRAVLKATLGDRVEPEILYLNHDTARFLGPEVYELIAGRVDVVTSGLGDWLFRDLAFPGLPDNTDTYFRRHFTEYQREQAMLKPFLLDKRRHLGGHLEELVDRYALDGYDLVGFTSMFSQNVANFAMARLLKKRNPGQVLVMGGANCETSMGRTIARNVEDLDFVFSGPALQTFPQVIRHLLDGDQDACHRIHGVYSRRKLAEAPAGGALEIGAELSIDFDLPLDYDDFLASADQKLGEAVEPEILFETSRGCWWGERAHCTFCGLNGMSMEYRSMQADRAVALIQGLFDRYASRTLRFQSVDNILPRPYLTDVLPRLQPPEGVAVFYEVKADLKDHEMEVLARAGVSKIQPGIEALASSTLKLMQKGITSFQNVRFLKSCLLYGIQPTWNLLIGFPLEGEEVYRKYVEDIPKLVHLQPPNGVYPVRFDRFSPYFNKAAGYGLKLRPADFYAMVYPFDEDDLHDLAYFFVDSTFNAPYFVNVVKWIAKLRERVGAWQARWFEHNRGTLPRLVFQGSGSGRTILDSRSGHPVIHDVGETGLAILDLLKTHKKLSSLADQLPGLSAAEIEEEVAELFDRGLLFQEGDAYIHLVVQEAPEITGFRAARQENAAVLQTA